MDQDWGFVVIWQFRVAPAMMARFEEIYGPQGVWANFFTSGEGFIRTELTGDRKSDGRYLTLDFWTSSEAYDNFRNTHAVQYQAIDAECEAMTESEIEIGSFLRLNG